MDTILEMFAVLIVLGALGFGCYILGAAVHPALGFGLGMFFATGIFYMCKDIGM
jgi:hypothetical protein